MVNDLDESQVTIISDKYCFREKIRKLGLSNIKSEILNQKY
jgi:hypothetical protein